MAGPVSGESLRSSLQQGRGSASGKVILLGEHAVVYGHPAIAMGLDRGAEASAEPAESSSLQLGERRYELDRAPDVPPPAAAFSALLRFLRAPPVRAQAVLQIPAGAGLGASAALGVALARAVSTLGVVGGGMDQDLDIFGAAQAWENVFHGTASGVDAAAAAHGGCLMFTRGLGPRRLALPSPLELVVAHVEPGSDTRVMVGIVQRRRAVHQDLVDAAFREVTDLVEEAQRVLLAGDYCALGALMNRNQVLLRTLGVSTPQLDSACRLALEAGAIGAKLTGAGGGGCAIALAPPGLSAAVKEAWQQAGFQSFVATVGAASG